MWNDRSNIRLKGNKRLKISLKHLFIYKYPMLTQFEWVMTSEMKKSYDQSIQGKLIDDDAGGLTSRINCEGHL